MLKKLLSHTALYFYFQLRTMQWKISNIFNTISVSTVNYSNIYNDFYHKMDIFTPGKRHLLCKVSNGGFKLYLKKALSI